MKMKDRKTFLGLHKRIKCAWKKRQTIDIKPNKIYERELFQYSTLSLREHIIEEDRVTPNNNSLHCFFRQITKA